MNRQERANTLLRLVAPFLHPDAVLGRDEHRGAWMILANTARDRADVPRLEDLLRKVYHDTRSYGGDIHRIERALRDASVSIVGSATIGRRTTRQLDHEADSAPAPATSAFFVHSCGYERYRHRAGACP